MEPKIHIWRWLLMVAACFRLASMNAWAENWPHWRGPAFNGSSAETGVPAEWSKTENVAWSVPLPGPSGATPVIWDDCVFVSTTDLKNQTLLAMAVDRKTGSVLWQHQIASGIRRDERTTLANPSPSTDGKRVIFFYGNGELATFDFKGVKLWSRNIETDYGAFAFLWAFSSTPLLFENVLYLQVLQRDVPVNGRGRADSPNDSCLLAMNPDTGKELWRHVRPTEAVAESRESYASPLPFTVGDRVELLLVGGDCLTSHDPATGKELWRSAYWNPERSAIWRQVASPVAGAGVILACPPRGAVRAIKVRSATGPAGAETAWEAEALASDVPTPLFYQGDFFVLSDLRTTLSRVDPATGKVKWSIKAPGRAKYEASPTGADGRVYVINAAGEVSVVNAENGQVLRTIPMGEDGEDLVRSTIAVAQGQLFIRTSQRLYCVGRK